MSSELLIVNDAVIAFHPFCFDIAEYPFLLNTENVSARRNSQRRSNWARLLRSSRATYKDGEGKQTDARSSSENSFPFA